MTPMRLWREPTSAGVLAELESADEWTPVSRDHRGRSPRLLLND